MSRLNDLITELCPNGVEYKTIRNVFTRLRGTPITAGKMKEIEDPNGEIKIFAGGKTVINTKEKNIPNANITRVPAVLVQSRGIIDFVYYDKPFTFKNEMWAYTSSEKISIKFLYYVLKNYVSYFRDAASGMGSLPQISLPVTEDFKIPVPPLEVQGEIVRILDNFTELTAELTAELIAELTDRRKQYEFYLHELLLLNNVEYKKIKDVFKRLKGTPITAGKMKEIDNSLGDIRIFAGGKTVVNAFLDDIPNANIIDIPSVLVQSRGIIDAVYYDKPFTFKNEMWAYTHNNQVTVKFLYYILKDKVDYLRNAASGMGSLPQISLSVTEDLEIPFPSFEEQQRIVNILDRFDELCNDISEGLPAEIEARQKQYEYYRDKLLTFKSL